MRARGAEPATAAEPGIGRRRVLGPRGIPAYGIRRSGLGCSSIGGASGDPARPAPIIPFYGSAAAPNPPISPALRVWLYKVPLKRLGDRPVTSDLQSR
jgi:hypothetical protein